MSLTKQLIDSSTHAEELERGVVKVRERARQVYAILFA